MLISFRQTSYPCNEYCDIINMTFRFVKIFTQKRQSLYSVSSYKGKYLQMFTDWKCPLT